MKLKSRRAVAIILSLIASDALAAEPPAEWDGLRRVASKRMDIVYVQPGADFRGYSRVMVDPTEVSFRKNWRRDYNSSTTTLSGRVSEHDVQQAIAKAVAAGSDIFIDAWRNGGYTIAEQAGPDVLRVRTAIANISVAAPDMRTSGRSYSFSDSAGQATLVIEARDSMTGAILGRAVDQQIVGDTSVGRRTSVSNRMDFRDVVEKWAKDGVRGMTELKALSPIK